jgi:hypothetical protein
MYKYLILSTIAFLACGCNNEGIIQTIPKICAPNTICSFESDPNRELVTVGKKLILNTYSEERILQSCGEVEKCIVEEISYVLKENEKVQKLNYRISVCYHGAYNEFYANGIVKKTGKYRHGFYIGQWKEFDESGQLKNVESY